MRLSNENIASFKALYSKRFGKQLTDPEARDKASKLLRCMELVYRPMTPTQYAAVQNRQAQLAKTRPTRNKVFPSHPPKTDSTKN